MAVFAGSGLCVRERKERKQVGILYNNDSSVVIAKDKNSGKASV
jgi:hypothetical protein